LAGYNSFLSFEKYAGANGQALKQISSILDHQGSDGGSGSAKQ